MSKHTPGPWRVLYAQSGYPSQIAGPESDQHRAGGCNPTRWNGIGFPSSVEGQANANLIAAAPDLFDALEKAQMVIDQHIPYEQPVCVPGVSGYIRDALKRARGES